MAVYENEDYKYISLLEAYANFRDAGIGARKGSIRAFLFHPYTVWMTATFYMAIGSLFAVTVILLTLDSFFAFFCLITFLSSFLLLIFAGFKFATMWMMLVKGFLGVLGIILLQDLLWEACGVRWFTRPMAYVVIFLSTASITRLCYITNVVASRINLLDSEKLRNTGEMLIVDPSSFFKIEKVKL